MKPDPDITGAGALPQTLTVALALTTEASADQAEALARALLERRLVACVSLGPVRCHF